MNPVVQFLPVRQVMLMQVAPDRIINLEYMRGVQIIPPVEKNAPPELIIDMVVPHGENKIHVHPSFVLEVLQLCQSMKLQIRTGPEIVKPVIN